jgi:Tol biopolymer transport system component
MKVKYLKVIILLISVMFVYNCKCVSPDSSMNYKIVFQRGLGLSGEICTMNQDGTGIKQLTQNGVLDSYPCFSLDCSKIVFSRGNATQEDLYIMNLDGSGIKQLTNNAGAFGDRSASFSPDGKKIIFARFLFGAANRFAICTINADGSGFKELVDDTLYNVYPSFSPDGSKIVFQRAVGINAIILIMNADGSNIRETNYVEDCQTPRFSPDGKRIIYKLTSSKLCSMNLNGSDIRILCEYPGGGSPFYISADGTKIVFYKQYGSIYQICTKNIYNGTEKQVTYEASSCLYPLFSPMSMSVN